jgi:hypothetical protein
VRHCPLTVSCGMWSTTKQDGADAETSRPGAEEQSQDATASKDITMPALWEGRKDNETARQTASANFFLAEGRNAGFFASSPIDTRQN